MKRKNISRNPVHSAATSSLAAVKYLKFAVWTKRTAYLQGFLAGAKWNGQESPEITAISLTINQK